MRARFRSANRLPSVLKCFSRAALWRAGKKGALIKRARQSRARQTRLRRPYATPTLRARVALAVSARYLIETQPPAPNAEEAWTRAVRPDAPRRLRRTEFPVNCSERFREGGVYSSLSGRHARRGLQTDRTRAHTFAAHAPHELLTTLSETRHAEGRMAPKGYASDAPARAGLPTNRDSRLRPSRTLRRPPFARTHTNRRRVHTDA